MIRCNFHTHTAYCHGKDGVEELIQQAIALGMTHLGFSSHAYNEVEGYCMSAAGQEQYRREIITLREKYAHRLKILCGLECDLFAPVAPEGFDYTIASVHFVEKNGVYHSVDSEPEKTQYAIDTAYGGDFDAYAEDYFRHVVQTVEKHRPAIIGHLDLLMKFSEGSGVGRESKRYLSLAEDCVDTLARRHIPFEINTGAMANGYRTVPYPAEKLLRMIRQRGGKIMFSSDCHDRSKLLYGFDTAQALARHCGFEEYVVLSEAGPTLCKLEP